MLQSVMQNHTKQRISQMYKTQKKPGKSFRELDNSTQTWCYFVIPTLQLNGCVPSNRRLVFCQDGFNFRHYVRIFLYKEKKNETDEKNDLKKYLYLLSLMYE